MPARTADAFSPLFGEASNEGAAMNPLRDLNTVHSRKIFAIALILGLLGLTVFLSLKVYMLVQAQNGTVERSGRTTPMPSQAQSSVEGGQSESARGDQRT